MLIDLLAGSRVAGTRLPPGRWLQLQQEASRRGGGAGSQDPQHQLKSEGCPSAPCPPGPCACTARGLRAGGKGQAASPAGPHTRLCVEPPLPDRTSWARGKTRI